MAPDRVNEANIVYVVGEHERRIMLLETHTEDLGVIRRELADLKADVNTLRRGFYTFAFSVAASAIVFAISIVAVFK